jgi:hypothetical protein
MTKKTSASAFASTAAALFVAACGGSSEHAHDATAAETAGSDSVKCLGIHECKGQAQCGVEGGHACAGQNDCRGKGWIKVSQKECAEKGGTVL